MKTDTITIKITPQLKKLVVTLAGAENRTITSLIEHLILKHAQCFRGSKR